jgi:tellurite resistance protein TerA
LAAAAQGEAVLLARVLHSLDTGPQLFIENRLITLAELYQLPGAEHLSLSEKVTLAHSGDSYQLTWTEPPSDLCLHLKWQPSGRTQSRRLVDRLLNNPDQTADLDLGCFYQRTDGEHGVIQALGGAFGAFDTLPYIVHLGDDRTGHAEGETIRINGRYLAQFTRLLVYAYIYQGVANWSQANSEVILQQVGGMELVLKLDESRPACAFCAVAEIQVQANSLQITRDVRFFATLHELSAAYGWDLEWLPGQKKTE